MASSHGQQGAARYSEPLSFHHGLLKAGVVIVDSIEVWTLPLVPREDDDTLLDDRERARLARLRVAAKSRQFLAAQAGLRRVLARYLNRGPAAIVFGYGAHGKPFVPDAPELGFNLTHSGDLALVAVTAGAHVGVDLEQVDRERPFLRLAARSFDAAESTWLQARPPQRTARDFYRIWTLKEAYLKALGTGLTVPPASFRIELQEDPPRLLSAVAGDDPASWRLAILDAGPRYAAALCWSGGERPIRWRAAAAPGEPPPVRG